MFVHLLAGDVGGLCLCLLQVVGSQLEGVGGEYRYVGEHARGQLPQLVGALGGGGAAPAV